ncbi:hypothetical protein GLAREA_12062 [Glarea lozoyensis ATCC 20868]|uniref:Uncharacterized protein n=1 Tax=Glarea lozoyensis (strain ATCC 20868 / MF5171) TaxID=1116229 RepID=S3D2C7_GLAL2|nr:uncharacterized protein GLAREA_12062 [Glarea lozoyensis ATCC 20868]EPE31980.1 hypothetical protein GLAREA_12062 [Glarea lozoyensis ATCC 20868]
MASSHLVRPPSRTGTANGSEHLGHPRGAAFDALRSLSASPTPPPPPGPSSRSSPKPQNRGNAVGNTLHTGLAGKICVLRADALSHQADLVVCPADQGLSSNWNDVTQRIREAAGPMLRATLDDRYPQGLQTPPTELADTNDVNSPLKSYFGTVKHTDSFEMSNCDWLVHSCQPLYSSDSNVESDDPEAYNYSQIGIRNNRKYCSVMLALKRAHRVSVENRSRMFTVAIPEFQHGGQITPRDDAVLTLSALVNFFNHPIWGARRYNAIFRVDILVEPGKAGDAYANAYDFAWFAMRMNLEEKTGTPNPKNGFLGKPYPIEHPQLPIIDPTASYYAMTTRHSVDMGRMSSFNVSTDLDVKQTEVHKKEEMKHYAGHDADPSQRENCYDSTGSQNSTTTFPVLAALTYITKQRRLSSLSPTAEIAQRYRSPCPSPETPRQDRTFTNQHQQPITAHNPPIATPKKLLSPPPGFALTPKEEPGVTSRFSSTSTIVPTLTIEITPPTNLDIFPSRSPSPTIEPTKLHSPVEIEYDIRKIKNSRASYDEILVVKTPTTPFAMSQMMASQSNQSHHIDNIEVQDVNVDFSDGFVAQNVLDDDEYRFEEPILAQPSARSSRKMTRDLRALNDLNGGFDGPYWQNKRMRKRKRGPEEGGFTSVN